MQARIQADEEQRKREELRLRQEREKEEAAARWEAAWPMHIYLEVLDGLDRCACFEPPACWCFAHTCPARGSFGFSGKLLRPPLFSLLARVVLQVQQHPRQHPRRKGLM